MTTTDLRGSLAAVGAFCAVGSLVAASDVIDDYPVGAGQAARYAVAAAVLFALARTPLARRLPGPTGLGPPGARDLARLTVLSATGLVLFNACVIGAVERGDPAAVGVIIGCVPVVLAILGPLQLGHRPDGRVVAAALVVVVGAATVQEGGGALPLAGFLLAVGALVGEAAFSLVAVPVLRRIGPLAVSAWACLLAVPLSVVWSMIADGGAAPAPTGAEAAALAYQAVIVTAGGFLLWYSALGALGAARAGLFAGVLPVAALACSVAIGAEDVSAAKLLGVAVVAAGVTLGMRAGEPEPRPEMIGA